MESPRVRVSLTDLYPVIPAGSAAGRDYRSLVRSFAVAPFYPVALATVIVARLMII